MLQISPIEFLGGLVTTLTGGGAITKGGKQGRLCERQNLRLGPQQHKSQGSVGETTGYVSR